MATHSPTKRTADVRFVLRVASGIAGAGPLLVGFFWLAGRPDWPAGWAFVALVTLGHGVSALCVWRKDPELLKRRAGIDKGGKTWDKAWLTVFGVIYIAVLCVGALDGGRYHWSTMSPWLWPVGAAMYVLFLVVLTWAMLVNPHFEKVVRIQQELGHRVIDSGPYRIVRHPGYIGTIVGFILSTPFLLGSWWAFVPASAAAVWMVLRTALEDRMLRKELAGYADYTSRVRYRLVPGVW